MSTTRVPVIVNDVFTLISENGRIYNDRLGYTVNPNGEAALFSVLMSTTSDLGYGSMVNLYSLSDCNYLPITRGSNGRIIDQLDKSMPTNWVIADRNGQTGQPRTLYYGEDFTLQTNVAGTDYYIYINDNGLLATEVWNNINDRRNAIFRLAKADNPCVISNSKNISGGSLFWLLLILLLIIALIYLYYRNNHK